MSDQLAQHTSQVYRLALRLSKDRHAAEDLTQETMLKGCRSFHTLKSNDRVLVWLLRIMVNLWRDQIRTNKRQPTKQLTDEPIDTRQSAEQFALNTERLEVALAAMDSLPERQRVVLHLFAVEQMSLQEIADIVGINPNTAKVNLFHARKAMHRKLPQTDQSPMNNNTTHQVDSRGQS